MARTPLAGRIQSTYAAVAEANARKVAVEQVLEERKTRRDFLKEAGLLGATVAGATAFGGFAKAAYGADAPRVVVVGAGLAGLTCAYRLRQAGVVAEVYEASGRVGGRCYSYRAGTAFGNQVAEHGGELIDQNHQALRHLAKALGFVTDNLLQGEPNGTEDFYYVNGHEYLYSQLVDDLNGIYQKMHKDVSAASYPTTWDSFTQRGWELDHMSIIQWLDETVPKGGSKSDLGRVLDIAYNIEYGAECSIQSSLNLLYLLGYSGQGQFHTFGPSNEKYHVRGGNDQIPERLGQILAGQIHLGHELVAIARNATGTFTLTFRKDASTVTLTADHVVLALPFSILRSSVNYKKAGFEPRKVTAIEELGMGTNSKLQVQFTDRFWYGLGNNGNTYADTGYQNTWEVTRAQPGRTGILVDYTGGTIGASFGSGTPQSRTLQFLQQLQPLYPGVDLAAHWSGRATIDFWTGYQWTKGSYSYWKVGQYTKFSGIENDRQGNCHFCGEHTSQDFQGYLNGGVETGEAAAAEILADLKKP